MPDSRTLNPWQQARAAGHDRAELTSAHHCLLYRLQDLAIEVSLHTDCYVVLRYSGHIHQVQARVTPYAHNEPGNYQSIWERDVYLPPSPNAHAGCLAQLGAIIAHLESLLEGQAGEA